MFDNRHYGPGGVSGKAQDWYRSAGPLGTICGLIASVLLGPMLYQWTDELATGAIVEFYGYQWVEAGLIAWKALVFLLIFYVVRMLALAALMALSLVAAQRLPMLAGF